MMWYSIETRTRIYVLGYWYLSFDRNLFNKYKNQLLNTGLGFFKNKKVFHKGGEFLGNKASGKNVKNL